MTNNTAEMLTGGEKTLKNSWFRRLPLLIQIAIGALITILQVGLGAASAGMGLAHFVFVAGTFIYLFIKKYRIAVECVILAGLFGKYGLPVLLTRMNNWLERLGNELYYTNDCWMEEEENYD